MRKKYSFSLMALLAGCVLMSACNKYVAQTDKKIETTLERIEEYNQQAQIPAMPEETDTVRMHNDIWLGNESIKIMEGETLPAWLEKEDGITISIAEDATLPDLAQQISDLTNIPVRLDDLKLDEAVPEDAITVRYSGKLSGLLNYLSNRYGVYWQYRNKEISFFTNETRIFTIYALPTDTNMSASMSGSTMGEGSGSGSSSLSTSTDLKLWENIEEGVKQVVGDNGQLSFSRSTGTISVTASPFVIQKVARYVASWNERLARQVAITVRVLGVTLANTDNYGLDLAVVFKSSQLLSNFISPAMKVPEVAGSAGSLSMSLIKEGKKFSGSSALIQALSTQGKTRTITTASVTTMNNKVAPVYNTRSENYVKKTTVTTNYSGDNQTTDVDMDVDTITYGFVMNVLPRILDHGRLLLMFSLNISEADMSNTATSGSDEGGSDSESSDEDSESEKTTVTLPIMTTRSFMQEVAMQSGMTLVLTGFERVNDAVQTAGIGQAKMGLLGGQAYNNNTREVLVVLITPEILQSPLSPEALMNSQ